jgi:hypothetical protein
MTSRVVECGVTSLALSLRLIAARRGQCAVTAAAVGLQAREGIGAAAVRAEGGRSGCEFNFKGTNGCAFGAKGIVVAGDSAWPSIAGRGR